MCHSCGSSSPGCFGPAPVGLMGKRELWDIFWIPACAGMTRWVSPPGQMQVGGPDKQVPPVVFHSAKMLQESLNNSMWTKGSRVGDFPKIPYTELLTMLAYKPLGYLEQPQKLIT